MFLDKATKNREMMDYLLLVLNENKTQNKSQHKLFYSIILVRFGAKVPVLNREPASTDVKMQIEKYNSTPFKPEHLIVELFTGKSRNVKKPIATFKFDYS